MSFKCTAEILVSFLKLRNIDLLQQGLYNISVTARAKSDDDGGKKNDVTPVGLHCSDVTGRRGLWEDAPCELYPDAEIIRTQNIIYTRTFFIRFQEQVEILDEVACFRIEYDINHIIRNWKDSVVLTFDLHHCPKEDVEKIVTNQYERLLEDGSWEPYSNSACNTIDKGRVKGKKIINFKHHSVRHSIEYDNTNETFKEVSSRRKSREVRKTIKTYPRSAFQKVATREICIQNISLPHTEWVPVVWQNWYAASCQVLVHTNVVSMEYIPNTTTVSNDYEVPHATAGFLSAAKWALLGEVPEGRNQELVIRFFHILASYLSYSYFYCANWHQRLVGKNKNTTSRPNDDETLLADIRYKLLEDQASEEEKTNKDKRKYFDPMASSPEDETEPTQEKVKINKRCVTHMTSDHATPSYERVSTISETEDPPISVRIRNPCDEEFHQYLLLVDGVKTPPTAWLSNGIGGIDQSTEINSHAIAAALELTEKFEDVLEQENDESRIADTFINLLSSLSHENSTLWKNLSRNLPRNTSLMMAFSKKCFWRTETLRSRRGVTCTPTTSTVTAVNSCSNLSEALKPLQSTSGNLRIPESIPPYTQMTFTYPQHTFVEYELLSVGIPKGTLLAHGKAKSSDPPPPAHRSQKGSTGWSDDSDDHKSPHQRTSDPRVDKLLDIVSSKETDDESTDTGAIHLIVLVHGYQGNKYDLRALRNHLALSISVGVDFLVARSIEDHADDDISKLGDLLAQEVVDHIRTENQRIGQISFIGHSMGTIVIRAAIQCPVMEKYLNCLRTFVSLSGPHLGVADAESVRVSSALWVLSTLWQSTNIKQLRLDTPFLHSLSATDNIGLFKHVILLSSEDDDFVSRQSATLDFGTAAACRNPQKASVVEDILRNLTMQLALCSTVLRFNVRFHPVGRPELSTAMQRAVGKSVHIAFLANPDFIHTFVCLFRQYFV